MRQLINAVQILLVSGAAAAAQNPVVGSTVDSIAGDSIAFALSTGAITAGGSLSVKVQGGDLADGSDKADIAGAVLNLTDADANKISLLEIHRPPKRYLTLVVSRAAQNSAIVSAHAFVFGAYRDPIEQPQISDSLALVSPLMA